MCKLLLQGCRTARHLLGCLAVMVMSLSAIAGTAYTFGVVPQFEQRKLASIWKPILDEVSRRSGLELRLATALSYPEFETALEQGAFDFVYANPYQILRVSDTQHYVPLVRDEEPLRGVVVVRHGSPIRKPQDLDGKTLAVASPNSFGPSLLVRAALDRSYGVKLKVLDAKTHRSAYLHALNGLSDAAGGSQKTLAEQPAEIRSQLRVVYTTQGVPSHPIAAHPRVPAETMARLQEAFLALASTPAGAALLEQIPIPRPVGTSLQDYTSTRSLKLNQYWIEEPGPKKQP